MRLPELPGYRYEALLGEDPFAWTFVASHESGERRSIVVHKAQATSDRILYPFFKALSNPGESLSGAVPVHDYVLQSALGLSACATPFHGWKGRDTTLWQSGSLRPVMGKLAPEQALQAIRELADSLAALHRANLFHGGLRPSTLFLTPKATGGQRVAISGFGQIFMGGLQYLEAGEPLFYAAPEQLATGDFNGGRGQGWDVYSFGVIAYQILTGRLPRFEDWHQKAEENPAWLQAQPAILFGELSELTESFLSRFEAASQARPSWPAAVKSYATELLDLISQCLSVAPEDRPATMPLVAESLKALFAKAPQAAPAVSVPKPEAAAPATSLPQEPAPAPRRESALATASTPESSVPQPQAEPHLSPISESVPTGGVFDDLVEMAPKPEFHAFSLRGWFQAWKTNPVLRWQVAAISSLLVTLTLTYLAFYNYLDTRKEKKQVETELRESERKRRASIDRQAQIYQKIREEQVEKNQLISELNEAEDSKNHLIGQTKLARQLLRETQENGDRFFRLVLDNRDSDVPEFRAARAAALEEGRRHYERLVETYGNAPDFIVSSANAHFYLGRIYRETGEFGKSLASFREAEHRYVTLLENESTAQTEFVRNLAHAKMALGELAIRAGEYATARHYFTESSRFWSEARARDPQSTAETTLRIHENSLAIVECELSMDHFDVAIDAAMSVGVRLAEMSKESPNNHRVIGALAKSFAYTGRVLEARRELEMAREAYQQASDLYAKAVRLDAAVDDYQLGLGNSLARVGLLSNDTAKLEGAAEVLGRVVAANPYESIYLKTLADVYGALAVAQRDGGKPKNAIALEEKAISVLKPILEDNRSVAPDVKHSYAQRLAHLAELLGDSGKFDASRIPLREAIALLEEISEKDKNASEYRRTLARTRGMAGFACMKSGDPSEAKEHLRLAKAEWQNYMATHPNDNDAAQAVKWTSEQLGKLP